MCDLKYVNMWFPIAGLDQQSVSIYYIIILIFASYPIMDWRKN